MEAWIASNQARAMFRLTRDLLSQNKSLNLKNTIMVILTLTKKVMDTGTEMLMMMVMVMDMDTDTSMQKNMVMEMNMAMTTLTKNTMLTSAMMV